MTAIKLEPAPIERFHDLLDEDRWRDLQVKMHALADALRGHAVWNINSTARGGGVVELLTSLIPYDLGCGIDERWVVIEGTPAFFDVTKAHP